MNINGAIEDINYNQLKSLYFTDNEINTLKNVVRIDGKAIINKMVNNGIAYRDASRLKYAYDISIGKVNIETDEDLCKHLRKMFGEHRRLNIVDLEASKIEKIPRIALIGGIKDSVYAKMNSSNYTGKDKLYRVVAVSHSRVHIAVDSKHKPVVPYKYNEKTGNNIVELVSKKERYFVMAIDKCYCVLCNRYVIIASLRMPEKYIMIAQIIAIEGTKVYVYVQNIGTKERLSYSGVNTRIYDYGYKASEIEIKLKEQADQIYHKVRGKRMVIENGNYEFNLIDVSKKDDEIED